MGVPEFDEMTFDDELAFDESLLGESYEDEEDIDSPFDIFDEEDSYSELTDEELDAEEEQYFNSTKDDDLYFYEKDQQLNTFTDLGSLADIEDDAFVPVNRFSSFTPEFVPVKTHREHYSLWSLLKHIFYKGAGILFFKKEHGNTFILLEKRASTLCFANQWTIPGGEVDFSDECTLDTALREANEEIDCFHKSFANKYFEKAKRLHTSRWPWYRYDYFIAEADKEEYSRIWGPQPGEVTAVRWFNIKILPKHCHKTIRWLLFIAKLKGLLKSR